MATKALTSVALCASHAEVPVKEINGPAQGWRKLFKSQDANLIWQELFSFISLEITDEQQAVQATQEVFLTLLTTRITYYMDKKVSDRHVTRDILSLLPRR
jgi:hypothetical protein